MNYHQLITELGLNQKCIAEQMGMPHSTFKNKLNPARKQYDFTTEEENRLEKALLNIAGRIQTRVLENRIRKSQK